MDWSTYYKENKHIGDINEIATQYNMYVYQNQEQYDSELIRKLGNTNRFILQEELYNYIILQEGVNEYGILQEY
tara:strand:+ start:89 stop:310 length:222 start_codon:yes stop_codon:yes gene_type:complete